MPFPLITSTELKRRITPIVHQRVFDDEEIGMADPDAETQLITDASNKFLGRVGRTYDVDVIRAMDDADLPGEIKRIVLDIAQAMMAIRCPNAVDIDGHRMMIRVEKDLDNLRSTLNSLGVTGSPEPAANEDAEVFGLDQDDDYAPAPHTFLVDVGEWG